MATVKIKPAGKTPARCQLRVGFTATCHRTVSGERVSPFTNSIMNFKKLKS